MPISVTEATKRIPPRAVTGSTLKGFSLPRPHPLDLATGLG